MLWLVPLVILLLASAPGGATDWLALTGSSNLDTSGNLPTWTVSMPAMGQYEVHLFLNEGYVRFARSPTTTVADPTPATTTANPTSAPGGSSLSAPVLYFTDLASGPRSGNGDTSRGQSAKRDGAVVTVWGANLGSAQGTSTITLGGVTPTAIYYWGNATPPNCGAANLFNAYQKLQCIIFQVDHATAPGAQNIVATVGGVATNALSFTVTTSGKIYYVAPSGGDFNNIQTALDSAALGDVIYVKNGMDTPGGVTPPYATQPVGAPLALVVYPGHSVQVGDATHSAFDISRSQTGKQMVYSKFSALGPDVVVKVQQNSRFIGNKVQAPNGVHSTGAITTDGFQPAPNRTVLGNEITNVGTNNPAAWDNLYHVLYFGGGQQTPPIHITGLEVGYNYFHDNLAFRAINLYAGTAATDSVLADVQVHHNVVVNQQGPALLLGRGVVGTLSVHDNVFINTGQDFGVDTGVASGPYEAVELRAGYTPTWTGSPKNPITIDFYNNTILNSGAAAATARAILLFDPTNVTPTMFRWRNNLLDHVGNGFPYWASAFQTPATDPTNIRQNLWFGAGAAPAWDTSSVNADPLLVSAVSPYDLHLQATSAAIRAGANLTSQGVGVLDFDGGPRPASGAWSIGAYQFGTQAAGVSASGQDPTSTGTVAPIPTATSSNDATTTGTTTATSSNDTTTTTPTASTASATMTSSATSTTAPSGPQNFTRGQWTQWGTGTYHAAVWTSDGTATIRTGATIPAGTQLGQFIGSRGNSDNAFAAWTSSAWDTTRSQMIICCGTGDAAWTTNEVNVFDIHSGSWNPSVRPMDPTVGLFTHDGTPWPPGTFIGASNGATALIDNLNQYPGNALLDPSGGQRLYPNGRQHYGGMVYMPTVQKLLMWGGIGWYQSGASSNYIWEWDVVAKKWQAQTLDLPSGLSVGFPSCAWDSTNSRALCFGANGNKLYAYNPSAAQGSRMTAVSGDLSSALPAYSPTSINYAQLVYDSKRNHAVMFGGQLGCVMFDMTKPSSGTISACTVTGANGWVGQNGPGVLYDPVADKFVAWLGGTTLYYIDPVTFASVATTPSGGATPTTPN